MSLIAVYGHWTIGLAVFILSLATRSSGQLWTLANEGIELEESRPVKCHNLRGLSRNQRSLCHRYNDHMPYVNMGARNGLAECKHQMQESRWNCSTSPETNPEKSITVGSKEVAFSYAITSAGVVHAIARACKNGELKACGCSKHSRPDGLSNDWSWGGCGDDTDYAYGFAHEFIDARERESQSPQDKKTKSRRTMNIHNNEAGRVSVVRATRPTCKCHGVSGSCSLKTCWMQVPDFRDVGDRLRQRYQGAVEMKVTHRGQLKTRWGNIASPTIVDLVFLDSSPDYCNPNPKMGVMGTSGRECNKDSTGMDGCGLMCCGRGFVTREVETVKPCHCKFQWCCYVKCQQCTETVLKHICN
ncbi:protein Wnt-5-like [Styela clava]|uniref:protein Wnt-5-like n=1 Tax=Styela clava TaxID=7725 RepID=UPI00193A2B27|nr:protein Wnt-5-like [Styela clava]